MSDRFRRLRVLAAEKETPAATRIELDVSEDLSDQFSWKAGQHVTLRLRVGGEELRRSYSICAAPQSGQPLQIAVKRVDGGRASNFLNDHVEVGTELEFMPPFGNFCLTPDSSRRRTLYFFAAGSGITPIISMMQCALMREPDSVVKLLYGNHNESSVMLRARLAELSAAYAGRIEVAHVFSSPSAKAGIVPWRRGRIDGEAVRAFIDSYPPVAQDTHYFICGPGKMNGSVRSALLDIDVPANRIHLESFGGEVEADDSVMGVDAVGAVILDGESVEVPIAAGQTVLQALRLAGREPPFSCESGVCGACRATLGHGAVHMRARMALDDDEVAGGSVLTCQAVPTTSRIALSFG